MTQREEQKIKVPKTFVNGVPAQFTESALSLHLGANKVYRDQQPTNSFQIREFNDHYTVQLDRHNPEEGSAVAHAVTDALPYTVMIASLGVAFYGGN